MSYQEKFKKKAVFAIDYSDLDEIFHAEYGESQFTVALGQPNDSTLEFAIDGDFDEDDLNSFINEGEFDEWNTTRNLLNHLCSEGKISAGIYLIDVSW